MKHVFNISEPKLQSTRSLTIVMVFVLHFVSFANPVAIQFSWDAVLMSVAVNVDQNRLFMWQTSDNSDLLIVFTNCICIFVLLTYLLN